jgi:hypothetical protein
MYGRSSQHGPDREGRGGPDKHGEKPGKGGQDDHTSGHDHTADGGDAAPLSSPVYSDEVTTELVFMIEEEKLASDLYEAFYDLFGVKIFDNIAASEDKHFAALVAQADNLGIETDAFVFNDPGTFEDPNLQEMYDTLLAEGSASLEAALAVGIAIEQTDMLDLAAAAAMVEGTQLAQVYDSLMSGSQNHLDAFESLL